MTTIKIAGKDFDVFEHLSEIKDHSSLGFFNRFFNRSQLFKFFIGKFLFVEDGVESENDMEDVLDDCMFGKPCGQRVSISENGEWSVTVYKLEDMNVDESGVEDLEDRCEWDSFFVTDKNEQIYFFEVDQD